MCPIARTRFLLCGLALLMGWCRAAPGGRFRADPDNSTAAGVEEALDRFLDAYYDKYYRKQVEEALEEEVQVAKDQPDEDIYETMQGDQPLEGSAGVGPAQYVTNSSAVRNNLDRRRRLNLNERAKENFIQFYKKNVLENLGRGNFSMSKLNNSRFHSINVTELMLLNSTNPFLNDEITKFRSFYPSCELPVNTDQDAWKDDDIMNLFFNFDYISNDKNANIATATLRLYRLPENGTQFNGRERDCEDIESTEEEKLLRVSIYWYIKSLKKRRVKRKLADSRVISEYSSYVELNIMPATKAWTKGRNLGLGVLVEDQDDNLLRADKYFKGASCTVGTSTPKAIPTAFTDTVDSNELRRVDSILGRNSTAAVNNNLHLLPIMSICTQEPPQNHTLHLHTACVHSRIQDQSEKERLERLASLPPFLASNRHIRHQRQYLASKKSEAGARDFDPRSRIVGATPLFTREEWQNFPSRLNSTTVNR